MPSQSLLKLAVPGLVFLPAGVWLVVAPESRVLADAARGYPWVALGVACIVAWRFRRSRVVAVAVVLALVFLLPRAALDPAGMALATGLVAGTLAPLFCLLALLADRRLGAPRSLGQIAAGPLLGLVVWGLVDMHAGPVARLLEHAVIDPARTSWTGLPQAALAGAVSGLLALGALALHRRRPLDAALFWAALAGTLALVGTAPPAGGVWVLAGALALLLGVIEASHALAFRDELTDLPGRRSLNDLLQSLRAPAAVAIVDIDRFKSFNDRHGHDVGDQVLRMVATELGAVSGGGQAFRSGGEEFTIVFPGSTKDEARAHLEAVRRVIADSDFTIRGLTRAAGARGAAKRKGGGSGGKAGARRVKRSGSRRRGLRVTVSIGLAEFEGRNTSIGDAVLSADKAMYRAKEGGRNRVVA
jgi:GGDEF domain-containing protein